MDAIVTKEYLLRQIEKRPEFTIGRALLAIASRQTEDELSAKVTAEMNGVGFTAFDADLGTRCADFFAVKKTLLPWMVKCWLKPTGKKQLPKILKYTKQLNQIANERKTL